MQRLIEGDKRGHHFGTHPFRTHIEPGCDLDMAEMLGAIEAKDLALQRRQAGDSRGDRFR